MRRICRLAALRAIPLAAGLSLLLAASDPVRAQWTNAYTGRTFNNPTSCLLDTMILQAGQRQMMMAALRRQDKRNAGGASSPAASSGRETHMASAAAAAPPSTSFKPSKEYVALPKVAEQLGRNADERAALTQLLQAGLVSYEKEAVNDHRPHDIAEAMTFYVAVNYGVVHDGAMPSDKQTEGLYRSLHAGLLSVTAIQQATDRQKQALYEALVGIGIFTLAGYQQGVQEKKAETCQTFHALAAMNLQDLLSLPAERLLLTEDGTLKVLTTRQSG